MMERRLAGAMVRSLWLRDRRGGPWFPPAHLKAKCKHRLSRGLGALAFYFEQCINISKNSTTTAQTISTAFGMIRIFFTDVMNKGNRTVELLY